MSEIAYSDEYFYHILYLRILSISYKDKFRSHTTSFSGSYTPSDLALVTRKSIITANNYGFCFFLQFLPL